MRRLMIASLLAATAAFVAPAGAQPGPPPPAYGVGGGPERRWADAQARYRAETDRYNAAWAAYQRARGGRSGYDQGPGPDDDDGYATGPGGNPGGYARAPIPDDYRDGAYPADDRYENGYDPARHYRAGDTYRERALADDDRVYAGSDGRYYCRRSDGTTGLIAGGAAGGILGNVIDGGHSRTAGTLIGGAVGALLGRSVEQNRQEIRCR